MNVYTTLKPALSEKELHYFMGLVSMANHYLEFGSGGSTVYGASLAKKSVLSVDSSIEWQIKVANECKRMKTPLIPFLSFIDLGPLRGLGYPATELYKDKWPDYCTKVWNYPSALSADLVMVDGRFRVACFLSALIHCSADTTFLIHDFDRLQYHVIKEFVDEIATVERLASFRKKQDFDMNRAIDLLAEYMYVTI